MIEKTADNINISIRSRIEERQLFEEAKVVLFILGSGVSHILGGIGVLNFINSMSMGVIVRKREFATLESIGMTRKQLRIMLVSEGAWYAAITVMLVAVIGNGVALGIYRLIERQLSEWMTFYYPIMPAIIIIRIILAISIIVPDIFYRSLNKQSVVERLREVE